MPDEAAQELTPEAPGGPGDEPQYVMPTPISPEDAERIEQARKCLTAFLIVVEPDGTSWATNDVNMDMVLERSPTQGDMYRACAEVMKDIASSETAARTAQLTVSMMMQASAQLAEHQRQEKIATRLAEKGIRVPGR